jgi:predicted O-methyltransferase YrrM
VISAFLLAYATMNGHRHGCRRILEVGTANGYSGVGIAMGMRKTSGKLIMIE